MEQKLPPVLLVKIGEAKSAEELIAMARENGLKIAEEQMHKFFHSPDESERSDGQADA